MHRILLKHSKVMALMKIIALLMFTALWLIFPITPYKRLIAILSSIAIAFLLLHRVINLSAFRTIRKYLEANPQICKMHLKNDIQNATVFENKLWIGKHWSFWVDKSKIYIASNQHILWIYNAREDIKYTTHCKSNAPTLVIGGKKKMRYYLHFRSKRTVDAIISTYQGTLPNITVGFNTENLAFFESDINDFISKTQGSNTHSTH